MKFTSLRLALLISLLLGTQSFAQLPFQESFEDEPGTGYTLTGAFDDGGFDFFGRYAVPDTENGARDDFENGWDGGFGIFSQDNNGEDGPATVMLDIPGIDISGSGLGSSLDLSVSLTSTDSFEPLAVDNVRVASSDSGLMATFALGALASEEAGFDNYEAGDGDGISIYATIDGGAKMEIGRFSPPASGLNTMTAAGNLYLDADYDGIGTGDVLTSDLTDFSFSIVPEPNGMSLAFMGLLGMVALRKRR